METTMNNPKSPKPKRRWYQYSLRTLMLFMLVMSVGFAWLGWKAQRLRNEQEAVAKIERMGGSVNVGNDHLGTDPGMRPAIDRFVCKLLGFPGPSMNYSVNWVDLSDTDVTDADLAALRELTNLDELHLDRTQVTDTGLEHLKELTNLRWLFLGGTQVTDAGLEHLKELTNLLTLGLSGTHVTDTGLEHLKELPNLECLDLSGTQVADTLLEHRKELLNLESLRLMDTDVTEEDIEKLREALPNCSIYR